MTHGRLLWRAARSGTVHIRRGVCATAAARSSGRRPTKPLPHNAACVIVGGGSIGCSIAYHLGKLGVTDVLLLERDLLTSGTTWHTAGLLWNLRPNDIDIELATYTRELISRILPAELDGADCGFIQNGGLFIATTKPRMDEYKRLHTIGKNFHVPTEVLGPNETKRLYPLMNVDDVYGSLYSPLDGVMDPAQWTQALTKAAAGRGATVIEHCPVTGIVTDDVDGRKKVTAVSTPHGVVSTPLVINAAGAWGRDLAEPLGMYAPTMAYRHAYAITDTIAGVRNMPNVRDHDGSFYLRLQGEALQVGGYEPNPIICGERGELPDDFAFGLYDIDWETNFFGIIEAAVNRLPALEQTGIKSEICGPLSFTPDDTPLCGYSPSVDGYFSAFGFDLGMMLGGGAGKEIAHWVYYGRPNLHLYGWDIRRFNPSVVTKRNELWVHERTHERFATMYKAVYPKDEPLGGRNQKKSPFHDALAKEGCVFQERHGWERAGYFLGAGNVGTPGPYQWYGARGEKQSDPYESAVENDYTFDFPKHFDLIRNEAMACRHACVAFDMSYFGKYYLYGKDATDAAQWIFSNNVDRAPGTCVYTLMLNEQAGVEADLTCTAIPAGDGSSVCEPRLDGHSVGYYIAAGGGSAYHDLVHMHDAIRHKRFDVTVDDVTERMGIFSVQGPNSRTLLEELSPGLDLSNEAFPFSTTQVADVAGHRCRLIRLSFVGELGWELHVPTESAMEVYYALHSAGKAHGFRNAGYRALEPLSAEKGYRFWDTDLRMSDTPQETGLMFTCKLKTDIDFQGRASLEKLRQSGPLQRLICLTVDEQRMLHGLEVIYRDGQVIGYVRRAEHAFMLNKPIVYAFVKRPDGGKVTLAWLRAGSYEIESLGDRLPATYHARSPFDADNLRLAGDYDAWLTQNQAK